MTKEIKKERFGIQLVRKATDDPHILIQLRDHPTDKDWTNLGVPFSSFHLRELSQLLEEVSEQLRKDEKPDPNGFGYQFRRDY